MFENKLETCRDSEKLIHYINKLLFDLHRICAWSPFIFTLGRSLTVGRGARAPLIFDSDYSKSKVWSPQYVRQKGLKMILVACPPSTQYQNHDYAPVTCSILSEKVVKFICFLDYVPNLSTLEFRVGGRSEIFVVLMTFRVRYLLLL